MPKSMRGERREKPKQAQSFTSSQPPVIVVVCFFVSPPQLFSHPPVTDWEMNCEIFGGLLTAISQWRQIHRAARCTHYLPLLSRTRIGNLFFSFFFLLLLLVPSSDFYNPILFAQKPYHFFYKKIPCSSLKSGVDNFLYFFNSGWKTPHPKKLKQEFGMILNSHPNVSTRDRKIK